MKWLDKLERKYGKYAIHGLMKYIVAINLGVFLFATMGFSNLVSNLFLIPSKVFEGQIWRIITFVFVPMSSSPVWILFTLYFYYIIGMGLEQAWGSFRFNVYYIIGVLATAAVTLLFGALGINFIGSAEYLNLTLFLAFATIYPNHEVLLFFILPIKMKYLALFDGLLLIAEFIGGGLGVKVLLVASLANYLIFFGGDFLKMLHIQRKVKKNREKFKVIEMKNYSRHRCEVCGITERDDPDMEFRYCSKCTGNKEYCMNHIKNHEHK